MQDQDPRSHLPDKSTVPLPRHTHPPMHEDEAQEPPTVEKQEPIISSSSASPPEGDVVLADTKADKIYEGPAYETLHAYDELPRSSESAAPPSSQEYSYPPPLIDELHPSFEHEYASYHYPPPLAEPSPPQSFWAHKPARFWLVVGTLVLLLIALPIVLLQGISYLNRPTAMKTLDTFCDSLVHEQYPQAYEQFGPGLQSRLPRTRFIVLLAQDRVVKCTHGVADENNSPIRVNLDLVHDSQGINRDVVTVKREADNEWKIEEVQRAYNRQ
ncbi:hypothetical protein [Ktedonobacter robiniae]|uniref:DUF4878 domain-containing protein n=1 Tax=Ktedonobacter robiniae TaxID=2778365 RepID=A0ABQ3UJ63_9CHLR|nr:hypothetical protein [Ktedonobacter robiniae]GHO52759.1 hypothetical protein KSB_12340 [Ktedonobacter robiniae]